MRMQRIAVEYAQFFDGRHRGLVTGGNRGTPFHRHWRIGGKYGAILTDQFRDPIFGWSGADEIKRQTAMPWLQPQHSRFRSDIILLLKNPRQPFDSWILEKCRNIQARPQCLVDFANDEDYQPRVPAQVKEIVAHPDLLEVEHLAPNPRQNLFGRSAGLNQGGICFLYRPFRWRQRFAVELAAGRQRK